MTRKDIEDAVWKVLMRGDKAELHGVLTDAFAPVEYGKRMVLMGAEEAEANVEIADAARVAFSRVLSMAAKTKISFVGDVR